MGNKLPNSSAIGCVNSLSSEHHHTLFYKSKNFLKAIIK